MRVLKSKKCVDIAGYSEGRGDVSTWSCDGGSDQTLMLCADGTIRNAALNYCFTPSNSDGTGYVNSEACNLLASNNDYQQWTFGGYYAFIDNGGITQYAHEIKNKKSGKCLDVAG